MDPLPKAPPDAERHARARALDPATLPADPLAAFRSWFEDAGRVTPEDPNAMALATADASGRPSVRMVLMKAFDASGFQFFSNYESRKADELATNPCAALLFHWPPMHRQVRIEGAVERTDAATSRAYFLSRPVGSRLSAIASPQSRVIADRASLEQRLRELVADPAHPERECPAHWGGYRLVPDTFEFWQAGNHRLHDRVRYRREAGGWMRERLAP
ncbi:MAG: pyridoxamine 5'-phosphate oxidase [Candidatus Eisenbacteria bacterium]|uniref:Pyridoxamine 5'-phosphate oxidase n=1 Tax=Eiseniibacteriota bacterium TaxID=2212470 RepID=A0A849SJR1_UNCEI|nr:pyridoxamine 5'-phosphate oxidase [Candidatus Eisenbacteria bacterium]